jgi:acetyl esterase/lipase
MKPWSRQFARLALAGLATLLTATSPPLLAGPLRERLQERLQQRSQSNESGDLADMGGGEALSCAEWSRKLNRLERLSRNRQTGPTPQRKDLAYGSAPRETLDVYLPQAQGEAAPVILMVHGGGWCVGDKAARGVAKNKVERWTAQGFVFVSINYPMVDNGANALAQAHHVAKAAAYVQAHARDWGGDPNRLILMGHSAGAHLVSLVAADSRIRQANGLGPLLGTVSLESGAMDVVTQMPKVYPFLKLRYREAFGETEAQWVTASPFHRLDAAGPPWLGVCSTTRKDDSCGQARAFADKARRLGLRAEVLPQAKSHGAINNDLGLESDYTRRVEAFMAGLDPVVAERLK